MTSSEQTVGSAAVQSHNLKQWIKGIVYTLLLINWGFYISDDVSIAAYTERDNWTLLDWTAAFTTSIDEAAWFIMLFLFELETYLLSDVSFTRTRLLLMHGIRSICYLFLAHTLFAFSGAATDLIGLEPVQDATQLCQLLERDLSFGSNLAYTKLDSDNCHTLSSDSQFYLIEEGTVVTDTRGLQIERELAWVDLSEAVIWLVILLLIEVVVRLQDRGVSHGPVLRTAITAKYGLYGLLWGAAMYWIYRGHPMFAWDEALWILGFMAIDMNLSDWRKEIDEDPKLA